MTDRPSQWAIEQAVRLVAGTLSSSVDRVASSEIVEAVDVLARALDAMAESLAKMEIEPPTEGLGYGGVVRSHHDGD
jgi:hypothetical protein